MSSGAGSSFQTLVDIMARLRGPQGCPWDREQTYATLAPMLLEEAYEAFDALARELVVWTASQR